MVCLGAMCQISVALKSHRYKEYVKGAAYGTQAFYRSTLTPDNTLVQRRAEIKDLYNLTLSQEVDAGFCRGHAGRRWLIEPYPLTTEWLMMSDKNKNPMSEVGVGGNNNPG